MSGDILSIDQARAEVRLLDPELFDHPQTRQLVELGLKNLGVATVRFGTTTAPKWASGLHESVVFNAYHSGGTDGHTSVGALGAGVPRNVLVLAREVNSAAGTEVYDPMARATGFYSATGHDLEQLCGRSMLPEGRGPRKGDERVSAEHGRDTYLAAGGTPDVAQEIYEQIMVTAFNHDTKTQNVDHTAWLADPDDPKLSRIALGKELVAGGDLLSTTTKRGPLASIEHTAECMCWLRFDRILPRRLEALGIVPASIETIEAMLIVIGDDDILREQFVTLMAEQSVFYSRFVRFSDTAIRRACGQGVDDVSPGRLTNAVILDDYTAQLRDGVPPVDLWRQARELAGYTTHTGPGSGSGSSLVPAQRDRAGGVSAQADVDSRSAAHLAAGGTRLEAALAAARAEIGKLDNAIHTRMHAIREHLATASRLSETVRCGNVHDSVDRHEAAAAAALAGAGQDVETAVQHEFERIEGTRR